MANSEDRYEMPHDAAFSSGSALFAKDKIDVERKKCSFFLIITYGPATEIILTILYVA